MRRCAYYIMLVITLWLVVAERAEAQRVDDSNLNVTARVRGGFECAITTNFDFGPIDATGTDYGTPGVLADGRNGAGTGSVYRNQPNTVRWRCRAWPPGFVTITLYSTAVNHTGGMNPDDLEIRLRGQGLFGIGSSTGYQFFTSQANVMTSVLMGAGFFSVGGPVDLRLTVLDTDPPGPNTWVVNLRATAWP